MERSVSGQLARLHGLLQQLDEVQLKLKLAPRRVASCVKEIDAKTAELERLRAKLQTQRKLADDRNLLLRTNESKLKELQEKLNAAASNREFDVIRKQIEADRMANSVLEDEILDILGEVDQLAAQVAAAEAELAELEKRKEAVAAEVAAAEPELRRRIDELSTEIEEAEAIVPASAKQRFHRLTAARGADAMAAVSGGVCNACFLELSPQIRVELNSDAVLFCRSCGRLMYLADDGE